MSLINANYGLSLSVAPERETSFLKQCLIFQIDISTVFPGFLRVRDFLGIKEREEKSISLIARMLSTPFVF